MPIAAAQRRCRSASQRTVREARTSCLACVSGLRGIGGAGGQRGQPGRPLPTVPILALDASAMLFVPTRIVGAVLRTKQPTTALLAPLVGLRYA